MQGPDAAAFVGNLAHESTQMQEQHPRGGRGGLGYAQWIGPRRREFEALLHGRSPADYELPHAAQVEREFWRERAAGRRGL
jgi:hypothetical protein